MLLPISCFQVPSPSSSSPTIRALLESAVARCLDKYGTAIGVGRNRIVFASRSGHFVVKVPHNDYGLIDNTHEARVQDARCTRCRLVTLFDVPLLIAERVATTPEAFYPTWVASVDCGQVGRTRKGRLVAYDFGYC